MSCSNALGTAKGQSEAFEWPCICPALECGDWLQARLVTGAKARGLSLGVRAERWPRIGSARELSGESKASRRVRCPTRPSKVKELNLVGDRLHYERISGDGPDFGWARAPARGSSLQGPAETLQVSLTLKGTRLLEPVEAHKGDVVESGNGVACWGCGHCFVARGGFCNLGILHSLQEETQ